MKIVFVIKIAVNIEHRIPILSVVANPLIGPEPINDNIKAVSKVVTFASKIVMNARSYPEVIEDSMFFPNLISSLILSKIITFASTAIPTVNNKPAKPGKVKTASIVIKIANTNNIFNNNAVPAIIPDKL